MTVHLYDNDSGLLDFTANVLSCREKDGGYIVTLDRTAFFPEGGGQGADHGTLGGVNVLDVHDKHGEIEHATDGPLAVGDTVEGRVDGARRLSMMQQHSGEHIFTGIVHSLFGYDNVGFHIGSEAVTMDFNGPLTAEDVARVERLANEVIWKNVPVRAWIPDKDELAALEYRSKKAIDGDVRIVQVEGVDTCACCGTHVKTTGSVGQIKVIGLMKYKSGVRVSILCGVRALDEENVWQRELGEASHALSSKLHETGTAVHKVIAERDALRAKNAELGMRVFEMMAQQETGDVHVVVCDAIGAGDVRKAAGKLAERCKVACVLAPRGEGYAFAVCSHETDVRPLTKKMCEALGGKGGGPKDMTQGTIERGNKEEIRAILSAE